MASPLPPDPYKILGVAKDAPLASIRSAHRKLVLTCHPDKFPDESVKAKKADDFHQVQQAYEILSDESRRQRYDERVKLAELRAELMADKRGPPRMTNEFSPRTAVPPIYESRTHAIYEERAPRRSYDDDFVKVKAERKFDEHWEYSSSRRRSMRSQEEERRRARQREHYEEEERRRVSKEHVSKVYSSQKKTRDKDRKRDHTVKYAQVEVDSDSDSDSTFYDRRTSEPKRKYEDSKRRDQEQSSRRSGKHHDSDSTDDLEAKALHRAINHVQKTEGRRKLEAEPRPSIARGYTSASARSPPPPPPPPAPPSDSARRSSGRTRGTREPSRTRSSGKERRPTEIVEPAGRASYDSSFRRPGMPTAASEPHNIHVPYSSPKSGIPHRSATMDVHGEPRTPSIQRASTFHGTSRTSDSIPSRSSKLRTHTEIPDPGYSSPGNSDSHVGRSPQYTSKKYQFVSDDDESEVRTPRVIPIQPDYFDTEHSRHDRHEREISPRARRGSERPGISRSSYPRITPIRSSTTYAAESIPSRQPLQRSDSVRVPPPPSTATSQHRAPLYREVSYSPKIDSSDIQYSPRPSARQREKESDSYMQPESRDRPSLGNRGNTFTTRAASKVY